jgi:hypothetical protein
LLEPDLGYQDNRQLQQLMIRSRQTHPGTGGKCKFDIGCRSKLVAWTFSHPQLPIQTQRKSRDILHGTSGSLVVGRATRSLGSWLRCGTTMESTPNRGVGRVKIALYPVSFGIDVKELWLEVDGKLTADHQVQIERVVCCRQ